MKPNSFYPLLSLHPVFPLVLFLIFAFFSGCTSASFRKAVAPPLYVELHIESGAAIISGDLSINPNAFKEKNEMIPEGYVNMRELDSELLMENNDFSYSVTYGSVLTLFLRSADENPVVIRVTVNGGSNTYTVEGGKPVKVLRFTNDYPIS